MVALKNFTREDILREKEMKKAAKKLTEYDKFKLKSKEEYVGNDLMWYFSDLYRDKFGYECKLDFIKDRAIFKCFFKTYGREAALGIMESVFHERNGILRNQKVGTTTFASGARWIIEDIYHEWQERQIIPVTQGEDLFAQRMPNAIDFF